MLQAASGQPSLRWVNRNSVGPIATPLADAPLMHYLLFLLLSLIWGTNFILMKKALVAFEPTTIAVLRVAGGFLPLLLIWLLRRERWPLDRKQFLPLLFVALIGYAWPFAIQPTLIEQAGNSGFIGMMVCFVPLMTIVVSIPLLGILPTWQQVIGVVIGLACSGVILLSGREQHKMSWWAIALAISVPLFYAVTNTFIKRHFVGVRAMPLTISALALSTILLSPIPFLPNQAAVASDAATDNVAQKLGTATTDSLTIPILAVIALGVIGTGLGILIFNKLLQERGPLFAGMVTYLIPLVAILWGMVDGEDVPPGQLLAFVGVLVSVALVQFGGNRKPILAEGAGETLS